MKKFMTIMSCLVIVLLLVGITTAFAAAPSPNYATNSHEDMSLYYYGYVQCQPSFVENGNHAARGYIRYWRYDLFGNVVNDTGRLRLGTRRIRHLACECSACYSIVSL